MDANVVFFFFCLQFWRLAGTCACMVTKLEKTCPHEKESQQCFTILSTIEHPTQRTSPTMIELPMTFVSHSCTELSLSIHLFRSFSVALAPFLDLMVRARCTLQQKKKKKSSSPHKLDFENVVCVSFVILLFLNFLLILDFLFFCQNSIFFYKDCFLIYLKNCKSL